MAWLPTQPWGASRGQLWGPSSQSQGHRRVWVGRDLRDHPAHPPAMGRDISRQPRVLRAPSSLALNPAREGAATAPLGSPGQSLATLIVKHFFHVSNRNLPSVS